MTADVGDVGHVLLTRFNLPTKGHESLVRARSNWLRDRIGLFDRYCLPSVAAQTSGDFSWLVYFDPQSPDWLKDWIGDHERARRFTPVFREEVPRAVLLADIETVLGHRPEILVTTNLDNDDSISVDHVARVRAHAGQGPRRAVYLADGLIRTDGRLYTYVFPHNAFCSVVEPWDDPVTCWSYWHIALPDHMPAVVLRGRAAWLQVVHGANVSNRVRGRLADPADHRDLFPGLLDDLAVPTRQERLKDALVSVPLRSIREGGRAAAKAVVTGIGGREAVNRARTLLAGATRSAD